MKHKKRFFIRDFSMLILYTFLKINFVHREVHYIYYDFLRENLVVKDSWPKHAI
jgi:hypothetical protein